MDQVFEDIAMEEWMPTEREKKHLDYQQQMGFKNHP